MLVGERHPHPLIRLEHRRRQDLRADRRQVDERRRVAVDEHFHRPRDLKRGARRVPRLIERRAAVSRGAVGDSGDRRRCDPWCRRTRRGHRRRRARRRGSPIALSVGSALMRLMSAAPRGVAANVLLERDQSRPPLGDDVERAQRVGVGEREQFAAVAGRALLERRQQIGRCDATARSSMQTRCS